jgi:hypothetical protein
MFWLPLLAGAGLGAAKHFAVDKPQQKRTAALRAEEIRLSPFTGQGPETQIQWSNALGSGLQGAAAGSSLWSGIQQAETNKKFADIALQKMQNGGGTLTAGGGYSLGANTSFAPWSNFKL